MNVVYSTYTYFNIIVDYMQTIISQFLTILKFNRYFIVDRLRERHNQEQMKQILDSIMEEYKNRLNEEYEILCKVTVSKMDDLIFIYETQTNLQSGTVNHYENGEPIQSFNKEDVKDIQITAFYHKGMSFEDIVTLASQQKKSSPVKKYRNKNFDRIIEVNQIQMKTPQKHFSPEHKAPNSTKKKEEDKGNKTVRKLMIVSQSQSMQVQPQKQYINLQSDESIREDIIIRSLLLKNNVKYQKNSELKAQKSQIKNISAYQQKKQPPLMQNQYIKTVKKQNKRVKPQLDQKSMKEQSLFMLKWLNKIKIDMN